MKATLYKMQNALAAGPYSPTLVDAARSQAEIVVTGYTKNRTEFLSKKLLSGAGIKLESTSGGVGRYLATETAMTELRRRFSVATSF